MPAPLMPAPMTTRSARRSSAAMSRLYPRRRRTAAAAMLDSRVSQAVPSRAMHDAIVVGGGLAGVSAARELRRQGREVLLLEARDRLGGRTWTSRFGETPIELGGGWVHWHQPHTWSELLRHGLTPEL